LLYSFYFISYYIVYSQIFNNAPIILWKGGAIYQNLSKANYKYKKLQKQFKVYKKNNDKNIKYLLFKIDLLNKNIYKLNKKLEKGSEKND